MGNILREDAIPQGDDVSPLHAATTITEQYDMALHYARHDRLPPNAPRPHPTSDWPKENIEFLIRFRNWLLAGGVSEMVVNRYHVLMAGHVLGLTLKQHSLLDPDADLNCAMEYIRAKKLGPCWTHNCQLSLIHLRRYLRLQRGFGEESKVKPFDVASHTQGLPEWLVSELCRFQKTLQRNWRTNRGEPNLRQFWCTFVRIWRFLVEERSVQKFEDLKRQHILDYVDGRLALGYAVTGVNADLYTLRSFLSFLQGEGYPVPQSLLRIPGLKIPDLLPKHLTDEQVKLLKDELERSIQEAKLGSHRRLALLDRAAFYLLWQGGMRLGEVDELRLEDLDLVQKRLTVRDGKGRVDRTVYLTETAVRALLEYLAVRGPGTSDYVFLFRHLPPGKDFIRSRLGTIGKRVGVKVQPHRLRHTMASQLLNAGCRITSIQRLLGHRKINTTLIYARVHDETVADDYFTAMERVEQRLELVPAQKLESETNQEKNDEVVKVQPDLLSSGQRAKLLEFADQLAQRELGWGERLAIGAQLLYLFGALHEHPPPRKSNPEVFRNKFKRTIIIKIYYEMIVAFG